MSRAWALSVAGLFFSLSLPAQEFRFKSEKAKLAVQEFEATVSQLQKEFTDALAQLQNRTNLAISSERAALIDALDAELNASLLRGADGLPEANALNDAITSLKNASKTPLLPDAPTNLDASNRFNRFDPTGNWSQEDGQHPNGLYYRFEKNGVLTVRFREGGIRKTLRWSLDKNLLTIHGDHEHSTLVFDIISVDFCVREAKNYAQSGSLRFIRRLSKT